MKIKYKLFLWLTLNRYKMYRHCTNDGNHVVEEDHLSIFNLFIGLFEAS